MLTVDFCRYNQNGGALTDGFLGVLDHELMVNTYGARNPDYKTSPKRFRVGFVYIARDLAEVNAVYNAVETSAAHFSESEEFGTGMLSTEPPFLRDTKFRGSVNGRFADLDGNPTPTLALADGYVTSADGNVTVSYTAGVSSGPAPEVSVVPARAHDRDAGKHSGAAQGQRGRACHHGGAGHHEPAVQLCPARAFGQRDVRPAGELLRPFRARLDLRVFKSGSSSRRVHGSSCYAGSCESQQIICFLSKKLQEACGL